MWSTCGLLTAGPFPRHTAPADDHGKHSSHRQLATRSPPPAWTNMTTPKELCSGPHHESCVFNLDIHGRACFQLLVRNFTASSAASASIAAAASNPARKPSEYAWAMLAPAARAAARRRLSTAPINATPTELASSRAADSTPAA